MHESVHYGSFKTRWMADVLAFFSGAAILNNAGFYRHYHMAHHRYTQDPARDPELVTSGTPQDLGPVSVPRELDPVPDAADARHLPLPLRLSRRCRLHPSLGLARGAALGPLAAGSLCRADRGLDRCSRPTSCCGCGSSRCWSACRSCGSICCASTRSAPTPTTASPTRARRFSNPIVRFLMWNLPYHAEHHLFPNIAFHNLPEAHRHLRPHLKYVARGYQVQGIVQREHRAARISWRDAGPSRRRILRCARMTRKPPKAVFECGDLPLQRGGTLKGARIVYKTFGTLSPRRDNVIVYPTSYSAQHTDIEWLVSVRALPRPQPLLHRHSQHVHQRAELLAVEHARGSSRR